MRGRTPGRSRRGTWVLLGLGLYALALVGNPLLHHDLACHLKSPTHCTACTSSPTASRIEDGIRLEAWRLQEAGRAHTAPRPGASTASPLRTSGRSPPA